MKFLYVASFFLIFNFYAYAAPSQVCIERAKLYNDYRAGIKDMGRKEADYTNCIARGDGSRDVCARTILQMTSTQFNEQLSNAINVENSIYQGWNMPNNGQVSCAGNSGIKLEPPIYAPFLKN